MNPAQKRRLADREALDAVLLDADETDLHETNVFFDLESLYVRGRWHPGDSRDEYEIELGPVRLGLSYEQQRALLLTVLTQLYGRGYARLAFAILDRTPCGELDNDGRDEPYGQYRRVAQSLWAAVDSWRDLWPQRMGGFDDRIWGVPTPPGVTFHEPLPPGESFAAPPTPKEFLPPENTTTLTPGKRKKPARRK